MKIKASELLKFLTVGAIGVIPNFIMFNTLLYLFEYLNMTNFYTKNVAWVLGVASGGVFNYIASKRFVFNIND